MPDDIFDDDSTDVGSGTPAPAPAESQNLAEIRKWGKSLERQLKAVTPELEELRAYRAERVKAEREAIITTTFKEVGLDERHGKLFAALNPDTEVNAEAVTKFASEYGLPTTQGEEVDAPSEGYSPPVVPSAIPGGLKKYTQAEVMALLREGKADEVSRAVKEGRVEKESAPWTR